MILIKIIISLVLVFLTYKLVVSWRARREERDFVEKEKILKIQIFKEIYDRLNPKYVSEEKTAEISAGVYRYYFNEPFLEGEDESTAIDEGKGILNKNSELKDIIITYLRTKSVFFFKHTGELFIQMKSSLTFEDAPTFKIMMDYGLSVPSINSYSDFKRVFSKFMSTRW